MAYRVVEIPSGGSRGKVNEHLERALVELGKAMHYAEAGDDPGYYGNREPMHQTEPSMQMPGRFMDMRQPESGEHSEEYMRGWNDHAQMMGMRTRIIRQY